MRRVPQVGRQDIKGMALECLVAEATVRTDGWQSYRVLKECAHQDEPVVTGSGKNAVHLFPWVHTLIANVKGNIRGFIMASVKNIFLATWLNFATGLTDDSGKTKCSTACSPLALALKPLLFRR